MSERANEAVRLFDEGFSCSQSVVAAYSELYGLDKDLALKISNGFAGGIARRQEICGAVSGAVMVIGLKYGRAKAGDMAAHETTQKTAAGLCDAFIERNGTLQCRELLGCSLTEFDKMGYRQTKCSKYVRDAAELLEGLLDT